MYQGQVDVAEEDLHSFLEAAEDLQIKGLSEGNTKTFNFKQDEGQGNTKTFNSKQDEKAIFPEFTRRTMSFPNGKRSVENESNYLTENIEMNE